MNKKLLNKAKAQLRAKKEAAEKAAKEAVNKGESPPEIKVPLLPASNRKSNIKNAKKAVRASIREANKNKEKSKIAWNFQEGDLVQFSCDGKIARGIIINAHFGTQNRQNPKLSSDYSSYLEVISTVGTTSVRPKHCKLIQRVQSDEKKD